MEIIELGDKVTDKVTGFTGLVTARVKYLNGCVQFCVQPCTGEDGKIPEYHYVDEDQLSVVKKADCILPQKVTEKSSGGVMRNTPRR